jgi:hypothetical protein
MNIVTMIVLSSAKQASVGVEDHLIYMFGGYCSGEDYRVSRPMDIHVLNTNTLRWSLLPVPKNKKYPQVPFQRYGESYIRILHKPRAFAKKKHDDAMTFVL